MNIFCIGFLFLLDCVIVNYIYDLEGKFIGVEYVIIVVIVFDVGIYECRVFNKFNVVIKMIVVFVIFVV